MSATHGPYHLAPACQLTYTASPPPPSLRFTVPVPPAEYMYLYFHLARGHLSGPSRDVRTIVLTVNLHGLRESNSSE